MRNHRELRARLLPPHHPQPGAKIRHWDLSMSHCSPLRLRCHRNGWHGVVRRQISSTGRLCCIQRHAMHHRSRRHGLGIQRHPRSVLWRLLRHRWSQRQCPERVDVPSEQHSRAMEACFLQRYAGRDGSSGWYCWQYGLPQRGLADIYPGT